MNFLRPHTTNNPNAGLSGVQVNYTRCGLYLLHRLASTPILTRIGILLVSMGQIVAATAINLVRGLIFSWVNLFIFTSQSLVAQGEVKENPTCVDGRKTASGGPPGVVWRQ